MVEQVSWKHLEIDLVARDLQIFKSGRPELANVEPIGSRYAGSLTQQGWIPLYFARNVYYVKCTQSTTLYDVICAYCSPIHTFFKLEFMANVCLV